MYLREDNTVVLVSLSKSCTNRSKGGIFTICCCLFQENPILTKEGSEF